ncbi:MULTISPECIES: hypothetical protein [unclassified Endozoicomonas]|nr:MULTISPECIES: hypothetical protein [unclassified Endozoicomonas]
MTINNNNVKPFESQHLTDMNDGGNPVTDNQAVDDNTTASAGTFQG